MLFGRMWKFIGLLDVCVGERVDCSEDVMRYLRGETNDAPFKVG